jgi:pimeloyl-ACP methyl ester carboxylesterase
MSTFVLIHGAFHGGWCWDRVKPLLEAKGHTVIAPDLPSHGDDPARPEDVTLDDYVSRVGSVLQSTSEPVVLVGHSLGGVTITQSGENYAERISKLVYLTAAIPGDGQSRLDVREGYQGSSLEGFRILSEDGKTMTVQEDGVKPAFYADCDDATVAWVAERLTPQATIIPKTPVSTTPERWGRLPRAYIQCTEDRAIPLKNQEYFCNNHPCDPVIKMTTSHSPFMSEPEALADHLHAVQ